MKNMIVLSDGSIQGIEIIPKEIRELVKEFVLNIKVII